MGTMEKDSKIFIAGASGMVGSSIIRNLKAEGFTNLIGSVNNKPPVIEEGISLKRIDLTDPREVFAFFKKEKPAYVFLAAAKVGGILGNNNYPAEFIYINLCIQNNVIHAAYENKVTKLLFLGSSCIYPKLCPQPMKESYLLSGYLEPTNEPYAIAKIAGIKMCQSYNRQYGTNFISVMPTNLYGPNDNFDLETSHVLPALIRKFHEAKASGEKEVEIWGTGSPRRELLHVDDLADACVFLMKNYNDPDIINIGTGEDITIKELAELVADITGFDGDLVFNSEKPDGTPVKRLDVAKLNKEGWSFRIEMKKGIEETYRWYLENI